MRVLVAGGTGALGTPLVPALIEAGHEPYVTARSPAKVADVATQGATPVTVDIFDADAVAAAVADTGVQAIINIATHVPHLAQAPLPWKWNTHHRLRRHASAAVARAAVASGVHTLIQEGVSMGYASAADSWIDESSPTRFRGPVATMPHVIEAARSMELAGRRGVCLLFGKFYGNDSMTQEKYVDVRRGRPVLLGSPGDWVPMTHLDSAVSAVLAALDAPSGVYNVNDLPVTKRDVAEAYSEAAGRETAFYPSVVTRLSAGAEVYARCQRVSAAKFTRATGWEGSHPDFAESFRAIACKWSAENPAQA